MLFGRLPWYFGAVFGGFGLMIVGFGWWSLIIQHYRLKTYLPVKAHVTESRVIASGDRDYEPLVKYSYLVGGHQYEGQRVLAIGNYSASGGWAWTIRSQFPAGANVTAYYSATDPASSFLSRQAVFGPHFVAMFGLVFVLIGAFATFQSFQGRRPVCPPTRGRDGWFGLRPELSKRPMFHLFGAMSIALFVYILILFGDYLALNKSQFDRIGVVCAVFALCIGVGVLVPTFRYWMVSHDFSDARAFTDHEQLRIGSPVRVRVEQDVSRHLVIDELSLSAVCMQSDRIEASGVTTTSVSYGMKYTQSTVAWNVQKRLAVNREYSPGSQLAAVCEFTLPEGAEPSTPPGSSIFPVYQWFIVLQVAAKGQPTLKVRFPIVVENGPRQDSLRMDS